MHLVHNLKQRNSNKKLYAYVTKFYGKYAKAILLAENEDYGTGRIVIINKAYEIVEDTMMECRLRNQKVCWHNGYTVAWKYKKDNGIDVLFESNLARHGYILDKNLEIATEQDYLWTHWYEPGVYVVESQSNGKFGMLNKYLDQILDNKYIGIQDLGNGWFVCQNPLENGNRQLQMYNPETRDLRFLPGEIDCKMVYKGVYYYRFKLDGKYGYYNEALEMVIPPEYDELSEIDNEGKISFVQGDEKGEFRITY